MTQEDLERFAAAVAAAEREKLAHWMRSLGYATGHGDTMEDLLDHLGAQIAEGLESEVLLEREACARVCDHMVMYGPVAEVQQRYNTAYADCRDAIRARSKT